MATTRSRDDGRSEREALALRVRTALASADPEAFGELLDPHVTWGPPGDARSGCHNRDEVLAWYRAGRDNGVRATVTEATAIDDRILVGLRVSGNREADGPTEARDRWQVLTVVGGRIADIRGFESRDEALSSFT